MKEPISHFFENAGFDPSKIRRYALGEKFAGIMITDGRIGICAVLDACVDNAILKGRKKPDLTDHGHRVILNSYFNAIYNYNGNLPDNSDIINRVDLSVFKDIVMVGYFESLILKLKGKGISFRVYDKDKSIQADDLSPIDKLPEALAKADAVIITGSSVANNTFSYLVNKTGKNCSVFLLGPSNILHPDMFKYKNIKVVFGSVFERYDNRILDLIEEGHGVKSFLTERNKVFIKHNSFNLL